MGCEHQANSDTCPYCGDKPCGRCGLPRHTHPRCCVVKAKKRTDAEALRFAADWVRDRLPAVIGDEAAYDVVDQLRAEADLLEKKDD